MTDNPTGGSPSRRIRPTLDTEFHIDYSWWERQDMDLHSYLASLLPEDRRAQFQGNQEETKLDWIDPDTAEIRQIDPFEQALQEAVEELDFSQMPLVDAVFKVFLTNGNKPLSPNELAEIVSRPASTILRTLAGTRVYRGLRPVVDAE